MTPYKQAEELMRLATKAGIALALISPAIAAPPPGYCEVVVCNKLERFSLSPWTHMKDKIGEACFPAVVGKEDAQAGKRLSAESRWYQGRSINITKQSVTRVKTVGVCASPLPAPPATEKEKTE